MADDLERAILLVFDPDADPALKSQALAFYDASRWDPAALLRLTVDLLHRTALPPVRFWCLQSLHDALPLLPAADLPLLHSSLLSLASSPSSPVLSPSAPPFLKNMRTPRLALFMHEEAVPVMLSSYCSLFSPPRLSYAPHTIYLHPTPK